MTPVLYSSTETEFESHGIGDLTDTITCTVHQILNGEYELEMTYPTSGIHYNDIAPRCIIAAKPDMVSSVQLFRIYKVTKPMAGEITIYARHIAYDLSGIPIRPMTATNVAGALQTIRNSAIVNCPFSFVTDKSDIGAFKIERPVSAFNALGGEDYSVLTVYGGEYEFDNYTIALHGQRGMDRGVSIRYGKNLTDIQQDVDSSGTWTGVLGFWKPSSDDATPVIGNIIPTGEFDYTRVMTLDLSADFATEPTVEEIDSATEAYIHTHDIGQIPLSISVSFALLSQSEEYKTLATSESVGMGDTVHVYYADLGVNSTTRVQETMYDVIADRYETITLGNIEASFAEQMATNAKKLQAKPDISMVESIAATISDRLMGANGGAVRLLDTNNDGEPDTFYIADNPDPNLAVKVWRFNYSGWGASSSGYNGPYTMGATLDDGLLADFITAAHLTAGTISSSSGNFFIDLSTGVLTTSVESVYHAADYSQSDITRINNIILGRVTPTEADYAKYDFYGFGAIDANDLVKVQAMLNTGLDLTISWQVKIEPSNRAETIKVISSASGAVVESTTSFASGAMRTSANDMYISNASVLDTGIIASGDMQAGGTLVGNPLPMRTRSIVAVIVASNTSYTTYIPMQIIGAGTSTAIYDGAAYRAVEISADSGSITITNLSGAAINDITLYYVR